MFETAIPDAANVQPLNPEWVRDTVRSTLNEDLGGFPGRDVTSQATLSPFEHVTAHLMARESGVIAGLSIVAETLAQVAERFDFGDTTKVTYEVRDGAKVEAGTRLAVLEAPVQVLLMAERTLLNLISRASGVATHTAKFAEQLVGTNAMVLDTRKTTPGLRELEKYAVRAGGGTNKRMGLYDVAMVKDNHIVAAGSVAAAITAVRAKFPDVLIQVEADTFEQAIEAVQSGARFLLLDNMTNPEMTRVVNHLRAGEAETGPIELEATGTVTIERAAGIAATGVNYMSVGALTHSSPILDLALDFTTA